MAFFCFKEENNMENKELKKFMNSIAKEEKLEDLILKRNKKVQLEEIKALINGIFKKYKTFDYVEGCILDLVDSINNVDIENFEESEVQSIEAFNDFIVDDVMSFYYNKIEKDSILDFIMFLVENKIEIFLNELGYPIKMICEISEDELVVIISEAASNTRLNVGKNEEIDYYSKFIIELNDSLKGHLG